MHRITGIRPIPFWPVLLLALSVTPLTGWGAPSTEATVGWKLFFDPQLSRTGTHACATCHAPEKGFTDAVALGKGAHGDTLPRNTPTVVNLEQAQQFFWDGRAASLEEQALGPLTNPIEMDLTKEEIVAKVNSDPNYRKAFAALGSKTIDLAVITKAIAEFERRLKTGETPYDRWLAGDKQALNPAQERGRMIFFTRGQCATCHMGPHLTDNGLHNIGTGKAMDLGRFTVTKDAADKGVFKTAALRNWKGTEPFMHDGSHASMADVLDFYSEPTEVTVGESELDPLALDDEEKSDLLAFLQSLNGSWPDLSAYPQAWEDIMACDANGKNTRYLESK